MVPQPFEIVVCFKGQNTMISHYQNSLQVMQGSILQMPTLSTQEVRVCIVHLSSLMYLHMAMLFEIECGRADWGDLLLWSQGS